jgi:tRNA A-37 threonylcarbamoyl transferase component Bud32
MPEWLAVRPQRRAERSGHLDVPAGYRMTSRDGLNIVVKEGYAECFDGFVMPEISVGELGDSDLHGRSLLTMLPLHDGSNDRAVVRRCVRGGILGKFLKELYLVGAGFRPLRELKVSEHARAHGISTPEILAVAFERVGLFFYRGAVATREVKQSADLEAELGSIGCPVAGETLAEKRTATALLGKLVAKMHGAGIWHADLHLKNVLLAREKGVSRLYLLDLDAARLFHPLSDFMKCANLLRLYRSVEKVNRRRAVVTRTDVLRFLRAYSDESSETIRSLTEKLARLQPFWQLKWKISDSMGV